VATTRHTWQDSPQGLLLRTQQWLGVMAPSVHTQYDASLMAQMANGVVQDKYLGGAKNVPAGNVTAAGYMAGECVCVCVCVCVCAHVGVCMACTRLPPGDACATLPPLLPLLLLLLLLLLHRCCHCHCRCCRCCCCRCRMCVHPAALHYAQEYGSLPRWLPAAFAANNVVQ
jgi:hypothetical protein